jgi:hypothetical protein
VTKYRLLCATEPSSHMRPERQFDALNDAQAISLVEECRDVRAAELWTSRYRLVATWHAGAVRPHDRRLKPDLPMISARYPSH